MTPEQQNLHELIMHTDIKNTRLAFQLLESGAGSLGDMKPYVDLMTIGSVLRGNFDFKANIKYLWNADYFHSVLEQIRRMVILQPDGNAHELNGFIAEVTCLIGAKHINSSLLKGIEVEIVVCREHMTLVVAKALKSIEAFYFKGDILARFGHSSIFSHLLDLAVNVKEDISITIEGEYEFRAYVNQLEHVLHRV